ncbi:hypothetical protein O3P69_003898 [Scylla paramamosain]|uniref:Diphthamide biosynthesis protein 3 n=1 Tax=Scylla paramamosain TaxID=85552 RepID=A0AAW0UI12_SCYPA
MAGRNEDTERAMSVYHDEIEIEDFDFDEDTELYTYPCPCGDRFQISKEDLASGEDTATCPSCSLIVKVIYNIEDFAEIAAQNITFYLKQDGWKRSWAWPRKGYEFGAAWGTEGRSLTR